MVDKEEHKIGHSLAMSVDEDTIERDIQEYKEDVEEETLKNPIEQVDNDSTLSKLGDISGISIMQGEMGGTKSTMKDED